MIEPGDFDVIAEATGRSGNLSVSGLKLTARAKFRVMEPSALEYRPPTARPELLREIANATREAGGSYQSVTMLADTIERISATDRRQREETTRRYAPGQDDPWWALGMIVAALAVEWGIRKRFGMT